MSRTSRAAALLTAAGGLVALSLVPAAAASAGSGNPPDCSVTYVNATVSMTCTARPADQKWYELARCIGFKVIYVAGNLVTGDGTSSVHPCINEPPGTAYFEVDNG